MGFSLFKILNLRFKFNKDREINLSNDIVVYNILSRRSTKFVWESLRRNREWSSLIKNPYFAKINLRKKDSEEGVFCIESNRDKDENNVFSMKLYQYKGVEGFTSKTLYTTKTDVRIISSCNGVFLAKNGYEYPPVIINPLTGEKGRLSPPLREGWCWQQLMFVPRKSKFVSVRMCYDDDGNGETSPVLEISSADGGMSTIELAKPYSEDVVKEVGQAAGRQIAINGVVYLDTNKRYIVSLDICSEKYQEIMWPGDCNVEVPTKLVNIGGILSMVVFNYNDISNAFADIWMLKDPSKQVWSRVVDRLSCKKFDRVVGGLNCGEVIVFRTAFWQIAAYDVKAKQWTVNNDIVYHPQIHVDSLYPVCCS